MAVGVLIREEVPAPLTVILNPSSGAATEKVEAGKLAALFRLYGKEPRVVTVHGGDDIRSLASQAVADRAEAVIAAGGDGTVSAVAAVLAKTDVPMGVLPAGTLNHFARDLGVPTEMPAAVRIIAEGRTTRVDVCEVNGRIFVNNSSLGLYPLIVRGREMQQRMGYGKWPAFVWALFAALRRYPFLRLRLQAEGRELLRKTPFAFVGNNIYQMEGLQIGTRASLAEGKLCVYVTHGASRLGLLRLSLSALLGTLRRERNFDALYAPEVWIESHRRRLQVALDGEVTVMQSPLHYRVLPGALRVIAPAAPGS